MQTPPERIAQKLTALYGAEVAAALLERLRALIGKPPALQPADLGLSARDVVLITYGDQVHAPGEAPLATLRAFLRQTIKDQINSLHILPFYPYSSDDGFSVIDYYAVNPALGGWDDVRALGDDYRLMFDAVVNHISAESAWFKAFLRGEAPYSDYFISVDPATDLSLVRRPRALPLLTPFETARGTQHVWTTFSADQIDLNVANPEVLLELLRVLLFYVQQGARLIRLDAIGYLYKVIGTNCIHLPQTHLIVQLMRAVLDWAAPEVLLITETNVPHDENISYFGDGRNEAQMVYQFSLPPLLLHTLHTGDSSALSRWAAGIRPQSARTTFFNFTASHDGIGVTPALGILSAAEIDALVQRTQAHAGFVSYKNNSDGSRSPYELNITYFDAITPPPLTAAQPDEAVRRFLCSQAMMLAFVGVPGVYFHSLFAGRNDQQGVEQSGRYRSINREKLPAAALLSALAEPGSIRQQVFTAYQHLLAARTQQAAFHPLGEQRVLDAGPAVFALERRSPDGQHSVLALHNVRGENVDVQLDGHSGHWRDLLSSEQQRSSGGLRLRLAPYQVMWLKAL